MYTTTSVLSIQLQAVRGLCCSPSISNPCKIYLDILFHFIVIIHVIFSPHFMFIVHTDTNACAFKPWIDFYKHCF